MLFWKTQHASAATHAIRACSEGEVVTSKEIEQEVGVVEKGAIEGKK